MVARALCALTQNGPVSFFVTAARKLFDNLRLLSEPETEVIRSKRWSDPN